MGLIDSMLRESGGALVGQIAKSFGINEKMAQAAIKGLAPALTRGLQRSSKSKKGMGSLLDALGKGNHERTLNDFGSLELG
ncbi:MAG: hypothetical protein ACI9J2_001091 [Saprospiraceae bacterium]|jgi:hypothetical protein